MGERDDRAAGAGTGRDADDSAIPAGPGVGPGGLHAGGLGQGAGAVGGPLGAAGETEDTGDAGDKGGRIGGDQNLSPGAVGAKIGNQSGSDEVNRG